MVATSQATGKTTPKKSRKNASFAPGVGIGAVSRLTGGTRAHATDKASSARFEIKVFPLTAAYIPYYFSVLQGKNSPAAGVAKLSSHSSESLRLTKQAAHKHITSYIPPYYCRQFQGKEKVARMIKQAASSVVSLVCPPRLSRRLFLLAHSLLLAGLAAAQSPPTISKAFSAASVAKNQSVTLTFTITNPNPATDLTNVAFSDNLPSGLIIANPDSLVPDPVLGNCDPTGTTGVITPAPSNISLTGGQIPANATCTFSIDVLAISGGDQVNTTGHISSTEGGTGGTATATVTVVVADLTIAKTHVGNFQRGQVGAVYTITVTNSGGADTDSQVTVTDTLPVGLTATTISGSNWTCTAPPTLKCTRLDALSPGLSFEDITLTVNVAGTAALTVTNTAVVSGGGEVNTSNDTATDPTTVIPESDLTISKTHAGSFVPGQTGTYTITISNVGAGPTAGTVTVVDTLPSPLTATAISGTGWTCSVGTLTCTRADVLVAGASYP